MKKIRNIISNFLYKMATKIGKTAHIVLFINDHEEAKKIPNETVLEIMNKSADFACSMLSDEIKSGLSWVRGLLQALWATRTRPS